jgi:hypothetical protein
MPCSRVVGWAWEALRESRRSTSSLGFEVDDPKEWLKKLWRLRLGLLVQVGWRQVASCACLIVMEVASSTTCSV